MLIKDRREYEDVSFQLAPMIDMTFLLLVFFMLTSKISSEQFRLDIELPVASNAVLPDDVSERDIISLDGEGRFYVGEREMSRDEIADHLRRRFADFPPLRIYLRADQETSAKVIKDFMKMAAEAGAVDVIFASHQR